jgi:hypothetical protein
MARLGLFVVLLVSFLPSIAWAQPIVVGSGDNTAHVVINFDDGAAYEFAASFDGAQTGIGLFDVIEAETTLETVRVPFGLSTLIDGIIYEGHADVGFGGGDDWWHYWIRASADAPWVESMVGAADRVVTDGAWDGWVYGSALPPNVPEPTALALLGAAMLALARRRPMRTGVYGVGVAGMVAMLTGAHAQAAYVYDPADFATEVVDYVPGTGVPTDFLSGEPYDNPANALGRPTVDTTGDAFSMPEAERVPAVPVYGPWRARELVTVGQGGRLVVKFDRPVTNDPQNPHGIDLLVFGNSPAASNAAWDNRDPNVVTVGGTVYGEGGTVSVSQDGVTWHTFASGPLADAFAPTLGRVYDPANPDAGVGSFNQWWGAPTDPTRPLDAGVTAGSFEGKTIAQVAQSYGESAGGSGFDIGVLGLEWIQYVRVENAVGSGVTPDIDAFADVAAVPEPCVIGLTSLCSLVAMRRRR